MARTANSHAATTRRRILDAATVRFASQGLAGVSIRTIATDAGVNSALISHYFGSKVGLYEACLSEVYEALAQWESALLDQTPTTTNLEQWVTHVVRMGLSFVRAHASSLRMVTREVLGHGDFGESRRENVLVPFLEKGSHLIASLNGATIDEIRFGLQSMVFLLVRYGLSSEEDVRAIFGSSDGAEAALESHLVNIAQLMLCR